jgi:PAS domain S-box-containing protein
VTAISPDIQTLITKYTASRSGRVSAAQRRLAEACEAMAAELKQREAEDFARYHLAAVTEHAEVAIISKSLEGIIKSWNPGAQRLFGYRKEEMLQRSILQLYPEGSENEEITIQGKLKRGEHIQNYETVRRHKNGDLIPVLLTISPVRNDSGQIIGASHIARDMAARRQRDAQAALIEQLQSALAEMKALRGFIPICAHCKNIRDERGHWHGLEYYLGRHSSARFSHGVCPTCLDKHYGQIESSQLI